MPTSSAEPIAVRHACPEDHRQWLPLWNGYNAFYGRAGETALAADVTDTSWRRFMDPNVPMWALVALRGDKAIGLAHYIFHCSTTSLAPSCYMQDLFISENERRRGAALALIETVFQQARAARCPSVYWQTHRTNERASRLYQRLASQSEFLIYRRMLG